MVESSADFDTFFLYFEEVDEEIRVDSMITEDLRGFR